MAFSLAFHLLSDLVEVRFRPNLSVFLTSYLDWNCLSQLFAYVQELRTRPCPVIFLALSGAPKACMYKVLQACFKRIKISADLSSSLFLFFFQCYLKMVYNAGDHG